MGFFIGYDEDRGMIECSNRPCANGRWFHYDCIEILEGESSNRLVV